MVEIIRNKLALAILDEPHALIAGQTGSGKSTALDTVLYTLCTFAPREKSYVIIDLKEVSLLKWEYAPHCLGYARTPEEVEKAVKSVVSLMRKRLDLLLKKRQDKSNEGHIYLIIDEAAEFLDKCSHLYEDLKSIARLARAVNIHLIFATQSPNRNVIRADLALNLTGKLGLRCANRIESTQIIGASGCEFLPRYGQGLWVSPSYMQPVPVKIELTPPEKITELLEYQKKHCLTFWGRAKRFIFGG